MSDIDQTRRLRTFEEETQGFPMATFEARAVDEGRKVKVIVIGGGISGILCGIRIPQYIPSAELVIYDKNEDIGGTWFENKYPGLACGKVPSKKKCSDCSLLIANHPQTFPPIHTRRLSNRTQAGLRSMRLGVRFSNTGTELRRSMACAIT